MMKKALLLATFATLIAILLVSSAKAVEVTVTCTPDVIPSPGEKTTITVESDKGGIGWIKVTQPSGESSSIFISIPNGGGSISKDYPEDFPSGSTVQSGEYSVKVVVGGCTWIKCFRVNFFVIPESPLGTIMATATSLSALIGLAGAKHLRTKRW